MASQINSTNFPDFVANQTINFRKAYETFPRVASQLYDVEDTTEENGAESMSSEYFVETFDNALQRTPNKKGLHRCRP